MCHNECSILAIYSVCEHLLSVSISYTLCFFEFKIIVDQSNPISRFCICYVFAHQSFVLMVCRWHICLHKAAHYDAELGLPKGVYWSNTRNFICNFELRNHNFCFSKFRRCMEAVTFSGNGGNSILLTVFAEELIKC